MKDYKIVGIGLANKVFQVAALIQANKVFFNKKVPRKKFAKKIQLLPPSTIAMEACGSANYWAVNLLIWVHDTLGSRTACKTIYRTPIIISKNAYV